MIPKLRLIIVLLSFIGLCIFWRECLSADFLYSQVQDMIPSTCNNSLKKDSPWLMHCINRAVPPFLSARHNLSKDAFSWWKRLQNERGSLSSYQATVSRLFQSFPSALAVQESNPDHHRTCAVVGNSGNLKGSRYGPLIDDHKVVFRMNSGPVQGYEPDVGTKTTHRVMYPESAVDLDNSTHLVLFPFKIQDIEWLIKALSTGFTGTSYKPVRSTIKANKDLVMVLNPGFMMYVHEAWLQKKGKYPSTGFIALMVALHVCDKVDVFGYGKDKDGNWNHYWEQLRDKHLKTGLHPGTHEYYIIQQLAGQQRVTFYTGE